MTTGERIQEGRKRLGLSQEQLGEQLFVSRQTVSLWEKNQTLPTIDNILRLCEIFSVSADYLLGNEPKPADENEPPLEKICWRVTAEELKGAYQYFFWRNFREQLLYLFLIIIVFFTTKSVFPPYYYDEILYALLFGSLFVYAIFTAVSMVRFFKTRNQSIAYNTDSEEELTLYRDAFEWTQTKNGETVRMSKIRYQELSGMVDIGNAMLLLHHNTFFFIGKDKLPENSYLYSAFAQYMQSRSPKKNPKMTVLSVVLMVLAFCSFIAAAFSVSAATTVNTERFTENFWIFWLFLPLPIASAVFGTLANRKGYRCRRNIIAGVLMGLWLLLFGALWFLLPY